MRPPNPKLANDGSGQDFIEVFTVGIDNDLDADDQGNWLHEAKPANVTLTGTVVGGLATLTQADGTELSVAGYGVTIFQTDDPLIKVDTPVRWLPKSNNPLGKVLSPIGDAVAAGPGAWGFSATGAGPDPSGTGLPYEG